MKATRRATFPIHLSALFLASLPSFAADEKNSLRTWTDDTGRTIEAELIGARFWQGLVEFRMGDGRSVKFPLARLSEADRTHITRTFQPDPAKSAREIDRLVQERLDRAAESSETSRYLSALAAMARPAAPLTDEAFLRRACAKLIGRAPTPDEIARFDGDRRALIDRLIGSEEFVNRFLNFLGSLLRVEGTPAPEIPYPECESEAGRKQIAEEKRLRYSPPPPEPYRNWVKKQIRKDRPWNQVVTDVLTATGNFSENPATGYLLSKRGPVRLTDLSHAFAAFAGVEITCARCHDHPYEDFYQMDFYRVAAYFGGLRYRKTGEGRDFDVHLSDEGAPMARLPADYRYRDGEPGQRVRAGTWFGKVNDVQKFPTARDAFADWLTDESNPRFTINIVNRLWEFLHGVPLVEPANNLPGHLETGANDLALLNHLAGVLPENGYQLKRFLGILCRTETFSGVKP